jgi:outer membrane protein assembly factor BamA
MLYFLLLMPLRGGAQQGGIQLSVILLDKDTAFLQDQQINYQKAHETSENLEKELQKIRLKLANRSFLASSIDSLRQDEKGYHAYLRVGEAYYWARLRPGNVDDKTLSKIGFKERLYNRKPFHYKELVTLLQNLQSHAENHGYPFVEVGLDSVEIEEGNSIRACLAMRKNLLITFDEIEIVGDSTKLSKKYLANYLGIRPDEPYSLELVRQIPARIRELSFVREARPAVISFRGNKATVNLFLRKKKASKFDFLVGVLPRSETTGSRVLITVDGMFSTQNLLGAGERIFIEFRQPRPGVQRLDLEFGYPYVLGMPFGVDGDFSLYKRDSTFMELEYDAGISYLFNARHYLKAFGHSKQSFLLEVDEERILQTRQLPENLDYRFTDFGLEHHIEDLDYRFNPRKGWSMTTRGSAGFKTVNTNNDILNIEDPLDPTFDTQALYDSLDARAVQYQITANLAGYLPFFPKQRGVFMLANKTGAILSSKPIFLNEQYRLGGTKTLRGFDEEAITASSYSIMTGEYRFIIGQNSNIFLFVDYGFVESRVGEDKIRDFPLGFGAGMTFDTKVGVFGISYAYGRQFGNPIDFRAAKIHFGYVNYF